MIDFEYIINFIDLLSKNLVVNYNTPENFVCCCKNKDKSLSVWLVEPVTNKKSKFVFKFNKTNQYLSFAIKNDKIPFINIPEKAEIKIKKYDKLNTYVEFPLDYDNADDFIKQVVEKYVESFEPSDKFGCCSKYLECSDLGYCIHDNKFYSKACWYRKNLESGNNFYKKNKES